MTEITQAQVTTSFGEELFARMPATYATYRAMRRHPALALARALVAAPVIAGTWSVEADDEVPEERVKFVQDQLVPVREPLVETAMFGCIDFGWAPYEKVFGIKGNRQVLTKLKPLLQDITTILIDKNTGAFGGFKQKNVPLSLENSLLVNAFRVEGTQWFGESLLENARESYNEWKEANAGAARYDKKVAGSHFVVHFPPGTSKVAGVVKDNYEVARTILAALEASGGVVVPSTAAAYVDELAKADFAWRIDVLEDKGGRQPTFIDRLKYLDVCMVRALLLPERTLTEGEHGTKAEAGEHVDLALTNLELVHRRITRHANWYLVDQLLALNWGESSRSTVRLVAAPLRDEARAFLRKVYEAVLKNPSGFLEEFENIDTDALKDKLEVPKSEEVAGAGSEEPIEGLEPLAISRMRRFAKGD